MESIIGVFDWIANHAAFILMIIGAASVAARFTKTEADNKVLDIIKAVIHEIALNPAKDTAREKTLIRNPMSKK